MGGLRRYSKPKLIRADSPCCSDESCSSRGSTWPVWELTSTARDRLKHPSLADLRHLALLHTKCKCFLKTVFSFVECIIVKLISWFARVRRTRTSSLRMHPITEIHSNTQPATCTTTRLATDEHVEINMDAFLTFRHPSRYIHSMTGTYIGVPRRLDLPPL